MEWQLNTRIKLKLILVTTKISHYCLCNADSFIIEKTVSQILAEKIIFMFRRSTKFHTKQFSQIENDLHM